MLSANSASARRGSRGRGGRGVAVDITRISSPQNDNSSLKRQRVEEEVSKLISQTGLHKNKSNENINKSEAVAASDNTANDLKDQLKLIPLKQRYPKPVESLVDQITQDVELAAEASAEITRQNNTKSQHNINRLFIDCAAGIERTPSIEDLWKRLWFGKGNSFASQNESELFGKVFRAFEADIADLDKSLSESLGNLDNCKNRFSFDGDTHRLCSGKTEGNKRDAIASDQNLLCYDGNDNGGDCFGDSHHNERSSSSSGRAKKKPRRHSELKGEVENDRVASSDFSCASPSSPFSSVSASPSSHGQWLVDHIESTGNPYNAERKELFWNLVDPDDEIYTDSEEEVNQSNLRHAPFVRPLRSIIRKIRKKEKLYTTIGKSLLVFRETHDITEVANENSKLVEEVFYDKLEKEKRQKRQKWRQWLNAACRVRSQMAQISSVPVFMRAFAAAGSSPSDEYNNNSNNNDSHILLKALEHFQVVHDCEDDWRCCSFGGSSFLSRSFINHFAQSSNNNHTLLSNEQQQQKRAFSESPPSAQQPQQHLQQPHQSPLSNLYNIKTSDDASHPAAAEASQRRTANTSSPSDDSAAAVASNALTDRKYFKIKMCQPGVRFYTGRTGTIWGSPVNLGYSRTYMNSELFFWIKRLKGPLLPLHTVPFCPLRHRRPCPVALLQEQQQQQMLTAADTASPSSPSAAAAASCSSALSPNSLAFLLHNTDSTRKGNRDYFDAASNSKNSSSSSPASAANNLNLASAWKKSSFITSKEAESSESESEVKMRRLEQTENEMVDRNPSARLFCWSGFGQDSDVVRLGQVGRLRNSWDIRRRKKLGYEIVSNRHGSDGPVSAAADGNDGFSVPVAPTYSSSEESHTGIIEDQRKYRRKSRISRRLIKKQRASILEYRKTLKSAGLGAAGTAGTQLSKSAAGAAEQRRAKREYELLSNVYLHQLGPLEMETPNKKLLLMRPSYNEFPGSPISAYEEKQLLNSSSSSSSASASTKTDFGVPLKIRLGIHEERWTDLSHRKKRVRGMESYMDSCMHASSATKPSSSLSSSSSSASSSSSSSASSSSPVSVPLGFMSSGTDLSGSEYQLVGIDTNEFNRRFGDNKAFIKNLHGFEDLLSRSRDYYVILNESTYEATVVPGGTLELFWTKSAKQNFRDFHWLAMTRLWLNSKYRRKFSQKALRYLKMRNQRFFIWKEEIEKISSCLQSRISDAGAFRKARHSRMLRTQPVCCTAELNMRANSQLLLLTRRSGEAHAGEAAAAAALMKAMNEGEEEGEAAEELDVEFADVYRDHRCLVDKPELMRLNSNTSNSSNTNSGGSNRNSSSDSQHSSNQLFDYPCIVHPSFFTEWEGLLNEASQCSIDAQSWFIRNGCEILSRNPIATSSTNSSTNSSSSMNEKVFEDWSFGWFGVKQRLKGFIARHYGSLMTQYYHGVLPLYIPEYRKAREIMAEKLSAEWEFHMLSRKAQQATHRQSNAVAAEDDDSSNRSLKSSSAGLLNTQLSSALMSSTKSSAATAAGVGAATAKRATQSMMTKEEAEKQDREEKMNYLRKILPRFSLEATIPSDIYKFTDVVSDAASILESVAASPVVEYLKVGFPASATESDLRWSQTFLQLLRTVRVRRVENASSSSTASAADDIQKTAKKLKIVNWLVKLYKNHMRQQWRSHRSLMHFLSKDDRSSSSDGTHSASSSAAAAAEDDEDMKVPLSVARWICNRFMSSDESGQYFIDSDGAYRLMTTILWLCLHISGSWDLFNFQTLISTDWGGKFNDKFQKCATLMGMMPRNYKEGFYSRIHSTLFCEWGLKAPLCLSDALQSISSSIGKTSATFAASAVGVFFKEEAAQKQQKGRRGRSSGGGSRGR